MFLWPGLQGAGIVALVGQREAASVPKHMGMRLELQPGGLAGALDHPGKAGGGEGGAAFRREDERRLGILLTLETAERPELGAAVAILAAIELWMMSQIPPRLTTGR
jgi:hypothetical protein